MKKMDWGREGNNLLFKGEDVGMIGWYSTTNKVKVDMISYCHTYTTKNIKDLKISKI